MEILFEHLAKAVALALEGISVLLIGFGALLAMFRLVTLRKRDLQDPQRSPTGRSIFLTLGRFLLLGLEFTLAADIVRTAIAPSWNDIGKLASIAVIRTFLNYFLERDIERANEIARAT